MRSSRVSRAVQNLEPIAAGKHQIQENHAGFFRRDTGKSGLTRVRNHDLVVLILEAFLQRVGNLLFVFYDKNTQNALPSSDEIIFERSRASP